MIAAIRDGRPRHLAFYEPNLQFDVGAATGHGKVDDPNAGFSFHNYCLGAAPGLPARARTRSAPAENVGETLVFDNAEAHAEETGAALLMTEFGDTEDAAIHERVADLADRFMVAWTDWAYMGSTGQIKIDNAAAADAGQHPRRAARRGQRATRIRSSCAGHAGESYRLRDGERFELGVRHRAGSGSRPARRRGASPARFPRRLRRRGRGRRGALRAGAEALRRRLMRRRASGSRSGSRSRSGRRPALRCARRRPAGIA